MYVSYLFCTGGGGRGGELVIILPAVVSEIKADYLPYLGMKHGHWFNFQKLHLSDAPTCSCSTPGGIKIEPMFTLLATVYFSLSIYSSPPEVVHTKYNQSK